ncbi:MAG TPA: gamma carbonic anhydrase family protein [Pseudogracilibacillus sp.]|nr:gamma carbonic anhydrase family protein [Pseudogracilibacillus sp.]
MIHSFKGAQPYIHSTCFIAENATIIGDVSIDEQSSVWFQTVIRGDVAPTTIGKRVNIQDLSLIHQSPNTPVMIEDDVSIGHQVTIHACTIRKNALIGMGSMLLDNVEIGESAFIGAGSLVTPGTKIPPHTLALGRPAKVVRELTEADYKELERIRVAYVERAAYYREHTNLGKEFTS